MKIKCTNPNHKDSNPSLHVYEEGAYCFSCGFYTKDVDAEVVPKEKTNIGEAIAYIDSLPKKEIRGLQLPFDSDGYYIVWPTRDYYKKRFFEGRTRYLAPTGHRPPLLGWRRTASVSLAIVEGELNAFSLHEVIPNINIVSPGSATNLEKHILTYLQYNILSVIVDKDVAGVIAGLKLKTELLKRNKRVELIALKKDFNEILQTEGKEAVRKAYEEAVGMSKGMQTNG